jgi:hypothetical protein
MQTREEKKPSPAEESREHYTALNFLYLNEDFFAAPFQKSNLLEQWASTLDRADPSLRSLHQLSFDMNNAFSHAPSQQLVDFATAISGRMFTNRAQLINHQSDSVLTYCITHPIQGKKECACEKFRGMNVKSMADVLYANRNILQSKRPPRPNDLAVPVPDDLVTVLLKHRKNPYTKEAIDKWYENRPLARAKREEFLKLHDHLTALDKLLINAVNEVIPRLIDFPGLTTNPERPWRSGLEHARFFSEVEFIHLKFLKQIEEALLTTPFKHIHPDHDEVNQRLCTHLKFISSVLSKPVTIEPDLFKTNTIQVIFAYAISQYTGHGRYLDFTNFFSLINTIQNYSDQYDEAEKNNNLALAEEIYKEQVTLSIKLVDVLREIFSFQHSLVQDPQESNTPLMEQSPEESKASTDPVLSQVSPDPAPEENTPTTNQISPEYSISPPNVSVSSKKVPLPFGIWKLQREQQQASNDTIAPTTEQPLALNRGP